jgi:3-hydroxyacyl-CoA dehydrogenase
MNVAERIFPRGRSIEEFPMNQIAGEKVAILGANGTMGIGAAAVFAGAGYDVVLLARDRAKAQMALTAVQSVVRSEAIGERLEAEAYDCGLATALSQASIIFEALAEDLQLKHRFFEQVDRYRRPDSIVASVSSSLPIAEMAKPRSESFRQHFLGIHLFNPPHVIVGTEVTPHRETDERVLGAVVELLRGHAGRRVIVTHDRPGFAANRIALKVLNEIAQLAPTYGVAFLDYLLGPHSGRVMAPLATIDLIGWDVHQMAVDNIFAETNDEAHESLVIPSYLREGIERGRLGDKSPEQGGYYRRSGKQIEVLDIASGEYRQALKPKPVEFVERMKTLHHVGRYRDALDVLCEAGGEEAALTRRIVLGYVSYALSRVGEAADSSQEIDEIMSHGYNWAPPSIIVDLIGPRRIAAMLEHHELKVPPVVQRAAAEGRGLYRGSVLDFGRTFVG